MRLRAELTASAFEGRSDEFAFSIDSTSSPSAPASGSGGGRSVILATSTRSRLPLNGGSPAKSSYRITPRA